MQFNEFLIPWSDFGQTKNINRLEFVFCNLAEKLKEISLERVKIWIMECRRTHAVFDALADTYLQAWLCYFNVKIQDKYFFRSVSIKAIANILS